MALALLLSSSLVSCARPSNQPRPNEGGPRQVVPQETGDGETEAVKSLVEAFGRQLQKVSLLAPDDVVRRSIEEHYGAFVSPALLAAWQRSPSNAPGRQTSSPWPDRIEVHAIEKRSETSYAVQGRVIEVTSVEKARGGVAATRPIALVVTRIGDRWLIDAVTLGNYEQADAVVYRNAQYGFHFSLPKSWDGYSIVTEQWEGIASGGPQGDKVVVENGPVILIRHPRWTPQKPRQDIPIMVFTLAQWESLQQGRFHIGAAPVGPTELGRNSRYVFALPARYNFAFPEGYEEVEEILKSRPLSPQVDSVHG